MKLEKRKKDAVVLIDTKKQELLSLVGNDETKFAQTRAVMVELSQDNNLANCSISSIVHQATRIVQLGLNPNPLLGEAYVVPYNIYDKGNLVETVAQLQIGIKGYKLLGFRAGWTFHTEAVYNCDVFEVELGKMEPVYKLTPAFDERNEDEADWVFKNLKGIISFAKDPRGDIHTNYTRRSKLEKIRLSSPMQKSPEYLQGIWKAWAEEMYSKSSLKYTIKRLPIDSTIMEAIALDEELERLTPQPEVIEVEPIDDNSSAMSKQQTMSLGRGKDLALSIKSMGLSLFSFEDKIVVEGNTFDKASLLKKMGFSCHDGEWYIVMDNQIDILEALLPPSVNCEVKSDGKKTYVAVMGLQEKEVQNQLIELGFAWAKSKELWLLTLNSTQNAA